ncbi:ATP-dependent Zn protease [Candidatus Phytoplasma ziziphi]|uniref:ATP-dependent Zn protease n=1 Tax=Ziziphus jujuba witches'-broom phytoplasma TaxID=135727 RepID=A0A660HLY4_ZIZJU|nr:AAA family ATPase [Candidatus Phytoplasma ziziphi]AYJ01057.1 ATP-dependent Zn protease [Candidatus Phytoplasma ziziphi]
MFEEQDINNIKTQKKYFLFFCVFLFIVLLISFVLIIYVLIHHQAITTNENKIEKIHKNILNLEKSNTSISSNLKKLEQEIKEKQDNKDKLITESGLSQKSINNKNKDILFESDNFKVQDYKKFPNLQQLAGLNEAKSVAKGFVNFFQNKKAYEDRGKVVIPTGLMMYGTPGCGKTIFAASIARETELPFIEVSCSIFAQEFVGRAPKMVAELFDLAREVAVKNGKGVIIFLDECENIFLNIDSLKPGSEIANVVNEFKIQLEPREEDRLEQPIFVIGATNHIDGIEPAILSRFTHRIELKPGDEAERQTQLNDILQRNQFPITQEAKKYLLEVINKALDHLPPQYEKTMNGLLVESPTQNNYKKAYRVLESFVKEASLKSIDREIMATREQKECSNPKHKEHFKNNIIFAENNQKKQKTDSIILENCCECKAINVEDLQKAYQIIIDDTGQSLKK